MKKTYFLRMILSLLIFAFSGGVMAQTQADKLYNEGLKFQKTMTVDKQSAAIKKFGAAKALYSSQENKTKCDRQIGVCNRNIEQIKNGDSDKKKKAEVEKKKQEEAKKKQEEERLAQEVAERKAHEEADQRGETLLNEGLKLAKEGETIEELNMAIRKFELAKAEYYSQSGKKNCNDWIETCENQIKRMKKDQEDSERLRVQRAISNDSIASIRFQEGLRLKTQGTQEALLSAKSKFEQAKAYYTSSDDKNLCSNYIRDCQTSIEELQKENENRARMAREAEYQKWRRDSAESAKRWQKEYNKANRKAFNSPDKYYYRTAGFSFGYVQKSWSMKTSQSSNKVGYFDNKNHMDGIQGGIRIEPLFKYGFGLNTGIFYEFYFAKSDTRSYNGTSYKSILQEHVIHVPLHLEYRLHFSKKFQLFFYGGVSADYGVRAKLLTDNDDIYYTDDNAYEDNDNWNRFNLSYEVGGGIRVGRRVQFNVAMSRGILDMNDDDDVTVKMNKNIIGAMTIFF